MTITPLRTPDDLAAYIAGRCEPATHTSDGWMACCPVHDDATPSLSITPDDGKVLLYCHAHCDTTAIVAALGMTMADLFTTAPATGPATRTPRSPRPTRPARAVREGGTQEAIYSYLNRDGTIAHETVRYRRADGTKTFKQRRPDPTNPRRSLWNLKEIETVIYHLPQVLAAIQAGEPIYIPEGEKDVDALMALGLTATTNPMGAGAWKLHYSAMLAGAHLIILPDNDKAGRDHAQDILRESVGLAASLKVLMLPDVPDKGDVSDWLQAGHTRAELEALVMSAAPYIPVDDGPAPQAPPHDDAPAPEDASPQQVAEALLTHLETLAEDAQVDAILDAMPRLAGLDTLRWMKLRPQLKTAVPSIHLNLLDHARKEFQQALAEGESGSSRGPNQAQLAASLETAYIDTWAFDLQRQGWMTYGDGFWHPRETERINHAIGRYMDEQLGGDYTWNTLNGVEHLLRTRLPRTFPFARAGWLPFRNGALCLETMALHPHSPAHAFTWQLPHDYDDQATCPNTQAWLHDVVGQAHDQVQLLRAYLKAVITRRVDLERYLEMIGPGGTGKSTFTRLLMAVVGQENTYTTELKYLEANRFETSSLRGKVLMLVTDAERYSGPVNQLKAIVGEDAVRMEEKYEKTTSEIAAVLVAIAANEPIQSADYTSGLERRRLSMAFRHRPATPRDLLALRGKTWRGELAPEIPGVINWALAMPNDAMEAVLRDTTALVPSLKVAWMDAMVETNPLAEWADHILLHAPELDDQGIPKAFVNVGVAKKMERPSTDYEHQDSWLYPNYRLWIDTTGQKSLSHIRFTRLLLDLLQHQLHLAHVSHTKDVHGSRFWGIRLRAYGDVTSPLLITRDPAQMTDVTDPMMVETRVADGFDGCDGYLESLYRQGYLPSEDDRTSPSVKQRKVGIPIEVVDGEKPSKPSKPSGTHRKPSAEPSVTVSATNDVDPEQEEREI